MRNKVLRDIPEAEKEFQQLEHHREVLSSTAYGFIMSYFLASNNFMYFADFVCTFDTPAFAPAFVLFFINL